MDEFLFVYGKLKRNQPNEMSKLLHRNSIFIGNGYIYGRLYEIDHYPGIIFSAIKSEKVFGEILKLNPSIILKKLDEFEGAWPLYSENSEYKRLKGTTFFDNVTIDCWIYVYNRTVDESKRINSGIY